MDDLIKHLRAQAAIFREEDHRERGATKLDEAADALEAANARIAELEAENGTMLGVLAECRDAFPIPEASAELEGYWLSAMADPLEVPGYIRATLAPSDQADGGKSEVIYQTRWEHPQNVWGDVPKEIFDNFDEHRYFARRIVYTVPQAGCEVCANTKGGVPGNENIIDGKRVCDYCHADGSYKAAPQAGCAPRDERITKPAQVAGAVFRAGVAVETVIKAAQRNYQYRNDPAVQDYPDRFTLELIQAMDKIIPQGDREFVSAKDYEALARELAAAKEKANG